MAHKKGQGSSRNGRDSNPKYRGVKKYDGEKVTKGTTIVFQCGTKFRPGRNTKCAKNWSIFSLADGYVKFESQRRISVYPA